MITPPVIQSLTNENTMLASASIEDLEEYKKNACKILRSQTQCATAKIVEELIDQEIMNRKIIEEWNKIYEQFPEHVGMQEVIPIELENNPKQVEENLKTVLTLEYMGIHIEDVVDDFKQLYYFSVPERSTLKIESVKEQAETAEDLMKVAKTILTEIILDIYKAELADGEEDEEFYKDVENNISDYALFFAKVRQGEIWNKEMGKAAVNKALGKFPNPLYRQVQKENNYMQLNDKIYILYIVQ